MENLIDRLYLFIFEGLSHFFVQKGHSWFFFFTFCTFWSTFISRSFSFLWTFMCLKKRFDLMFNFNSNWNFVKIKSESEEKVIKNYKPFQLGRAITRFPAYLTNVFLGDWVFGFYRHLIVHIRCFDCRTLDYCYSRSASASRYFRFDAPFLFHVHLWDVTTIIKEMSKNNISMKSSIQSYRITFDGVSHIFSQKSQG